MAIAEIPLDPSTFANPGQPSVVTGSTHLRCNWNYNFAPSQNPGNITVCNIWGWSPPGLIGYGATNLAGPQYLIVFTFSGLNLSQPQPFVCQAYVNSAGAGQIVQVASINTAFPAGTIPVCYLIMTATGQVTQTIDARTSFLSSIPAVGSLTEQISSPTLRASLAASYSVPRTFALAREIPADVALPCSTFFLGAGSVNNGSGVVSTPQTLIGCASRMPQPSLQIAGNAVNYIFCDPVTGILSTNTTGFPANSLHICTVTTDAVALIRQISDMRNSYI